MKKNIFLLLIAITCTSFSFAQTTDSAVVKISNGQLRGSVEADGIHSFKGIPYAQPPVGDLRWKEPQAPKNWKGIRSAGHFGPQAMQRFIYSDMQFRSAGKSEDCLYLNVWSPAKSSNEKLPVLVYFYGGGFGAGDGSEYRYDGESLAKRGIVTITINYRLGIFGFFAHPELTQESPHHSSGNYGLMDQHAALLWVQKNIAAFGGDPKRVTIGGESAGSTSVAVQVTSPLSKGLFEGAISESGSDLGGPMKTLAEGELTGAKFAQSINSLSLADLRKIPADSLLQLSAHAHFPVVVDGYLLPEQPHAIFAAGKQMHVPLLVGWNSAETDYHNLLGDTPPTLENYKAALIKLLPARADDIFKAYPAVTDSDVMRAATDLSSDRFIVYSTWKFMDMQSKTSGKPVYHYVFARKRPAFANGQPNDKQMGASHSSEIEFALGNLATNKVYAWGPDDYKVSATMESYFANFIKTGDPNGDGLVKWDSLPASEPKAMLIDVNSQMVPMPKPDRYILADSFYNQ